MRKIVPTMAVAVWPRQFPVLGLVLLAWLSLLPVSPATAQTPITDGYRDFSYGSAGDGEPTGQKPESKMWWNDGFWWASLFNNSDKNYHIYRLDLATQTWIDKGTLIDDRDDSLADVLWDAATQKLYVASHIYSLNAGQLAAAAERSRLYRYTYSAATKTYTLDAGFPVEANPSKTETLVLAKDSTGQLWMSYADTQRVLISHTLNGDDRVWGSPYVLPVADAGNLTNDDISSVIAFAGKIGVLWSN